VASILFLKAINRKFQFRWTQIRASK